MNLQPTALLLAISQAVIQQVWPDSNNQAEAQLKLEQLQQSADFQELERQLEIVLTPKLSNGKITQPPAYWREGWRPFIGWICGLGLLYQFLIIPVVNGIFSYYAHVTPMPTLDSETLMTLLTGMLGFGGLRTFEKTKGMN